MRGGHADITRQRRVDDGRREAVDADEAQAGDDAFVGKQPGERFDVAHAVLKGDDEGGRAEQRLHERRQGLVGGRFQGDDDKVARTDGRGLRRGRSDADDALRAFVPDRQSVVADGLKVAAGQAMHLVPGFGEQGGVPSSEGARSDDADLHGRPWGRRTDV